LIVTLQDRHITSFAVNIFVQEEIGNSSSIAASRDEEKLLAFHQTIEEEKIKIITTAAKLIFTDLKNV